MKPSIRVLAVGTLLASATPDFAAEYFADQVISYTTGTGVGSYTNPAAALGKPGGNVDSGTFNPFSPNYTTSELARIGFGGDLTLRLSNFVIVTPGVPELGVWENVFLTGSPVSGSFGADSAVVSVSEDGVSWFSLNSGQPIAFDLPGNYYANATGPNDPPPTNPVLADFGQPFTGVVTDFNGQNFSGVLATLNGSAGGKWLDLDSSGLTQVGYVRFDGVASGQTLEINGVGINGSLAGTAVPEPGAVASLFTGLGVLFVRSRSRRRCASAPSSSLKSNR